MHVTLHTQQAQNASTVSAKRSAQKMTVSKTKSAKRAQSNILNCKSPRHSEVAQTSFARDSAQQLKHTDKRSLEGSTLKNNC
jgi:hypothetical protein